MKIYLPLQLKVLSGYVLEKFTRKYRQKQMSRLFHLGHPLPESSEKVLFWVPGGMQLMLHVEGAIAIALQLRGINVHAVICDGPFRACIKREITDNIPVGDWHKACPRCKAENVAVLESMGIPYSFISDFVPETTRAALREKASYIKWESLKDLSFGSINVGKDIQSAVIRYLMGNKLTGHEDIVSEYAFSGLMVAQAATSAINLINPSHIFMSHAIYVDWGPAMQIALSRHIPVLAWMASYLGSRFYFRHIRNPIRRDLHTISQNEWEKIKQTPLSTVQNAILDKFLEDRYLKNISFDIKCTKTYRGNVNFLRERYTISDKRPVWGIFTHLNWDAVSDYSPMAYETFEDWILDTVETMLQIPDVQWLIKIHPTEAIFNPRSGIQWLIKNRFPSLPSHIKIILAEDNISPLDFFDLVDGGVTVYGTSGLELALHGKPVILAGEAHYGGKGFTYDRPDKETYRQLLRKAHGIKSLDNHQKELARKYAYCYFIQRQIPFPVVEDPSSNWWKFQFDKRHLLLPGKDLFIDFICERIMDGKDFIMDEKLVKLAETFN